MYIVLTYLGRFCRDIEPAISILFDDPLDVRLYKQKKKKQLYSGKGFKWSIKCLIITFQTSLSSVLSVN